LLNFDAPPVAPADPVNNADMMVEQRNDPEHQLEEVDQIANNGGAIEQIEPPQLFTDVSPPPPTLFLFVSFLIQARLVAHLSPVEYEVKYPGVAY
jgi:hypothetical protein